MSALWMDQVLYGVLDSGVKSLGVLLVAGGVTLALRRSSAGMRHLVWTVAMLSLLVLPVFSAVLPAWRVSFLPAEGMVKSDDEAIAKSQPSISMAVVNSEQPPRAVATITMPVEGAISIREGVQGELIPSSRLHEPQLQGTQPAPWKVWALSGWLIVMLFCLLPVGIGTYSIWRIRRHACRVSDGEWYVLLRRVRADLSLRRPVNLWSSPHVNVPMTWGILRPKVFVPADAEQWPAQRRQVVLHHECAHIKRWDYLTQRVAQWVCALYWFNPLVWVAARQMRVERERACDDLVLSAGSKASEYAQHLLEIAASSRGGPFAGMAAVMMARPGRLESRLLAILDSRRSRQRVTRRAVVGLGVPILLGVVLPISMLRGAANAPSLPGSLAIPQPLVAQPATQPIGPATQPTTVPAHRSPYAWQSPSYIPPSLDYFPDDADAGLVLDGLFPQLQTDRRPDEEILTSVRKGLRRTTQHRTLILAAIGNRYIWNVRPQHPAAIELMYHALAFDDLANVGHYAIYFGLSVTKPKTPNILRAMVEAALRAGYGFDVGRIAWGCADQKADLLAAVKECQTHTDPDMRESAIVLEKHFLGQVNYGKWKYDQQQQAARKKYRDKLVAIKEQLAHGNTQTRRAAIDEVMRTYDLVLAMDASFLDAWKAAAEDPDVRIRREVARTVGNRWIWSGNEQSEQAVSLMIDLSKDSDASTRYNAVYFGLSTLRPKPDRVIEALVRVIVEHPDQMSGGILDRVLWGLRGEEQRVADALNAFLKTYDRPDHASAVAALLMHQALIKTESSLAERFAKDGSFLVVFGPKPPFSPKGSDELLQELKNLLPADLNVGEIKVIESQGRLMGGVLIDGHAAQGRLRALLQSSSLLRPASVMLATPDVQAQFFSKPSASGPPAK